MVIKPYKAINRQYYPSKDKKLWQYKLYLTRMEHVFARRASYLIKSCRSKNGKANVTYFYRIAINRVINEIINKLGGEQKFIERTNREREVITQKKEVFRNYKLRRPKRLPRLNI